MSGVVGNASLGKFDVLGSGAGGGPVADMLCKHGKKVLVLEAGHADLKMPRFMAQDFQLGTLLGGSVPSTSFVDWPLTYDQLEPVYAYAERALGVQGLAGANPFEGKRSTPFPMPPGVPMYVAVKGMAGAAQLGARYASIVPQDAISGSAHVMGTLRFGADAATSVCDVNGRFHDVGNLYATEMVFPASPEQALS